ncbi:receptor-like kinase TMK2 [Brassica rapa]|uniref:BnaA06g34510D protein n=3 Tax=Brassica TaxID=3705 RepID=A0A078FXZ5_BRANA|nr:receptor-like kinase TMK2 [Brassica rapa]KAH0924029.1 hypothetical protein HID58_024047 [Brassica napus]CAF2090756.1 unnamed protein product [Brassica napus]CAG7872935.1 unnamed protein product [Brassica rapa]CDY17632.1 BnaA06g34510D [Brassica napus]VDC68735.1 unnamed protein product [Brassica rapa]
MTSSHIFLLCLLLSLLNFAASQDDATIMQSIKSYLNLTSDVHWSDPDPCKWDGIICGESNRIIRILLTGKDIVGTFPQDLGKLSDLVMVDLHGNGFTGLIPDLSGLQNLVLFNVEHNKLTGVVPPSFTGLKSLIDVNLNNNFFQGPTPLFENSDVLDPVSGNSFCLDTPGTPCDPRVETLLSIAESFGYPVKLATAWRGNDPCDSWPGITCSGSDVTVVNLRRFELTGTISPSFAKLTSLETIDLSNNNLTGSIPTELTTLPMLRTLNVSINNINGAVPTFSASVNVVTSGNANIGKDGPVPHPLVELLQKMNKD